MTATLRSPVVPPDAAAGRPGPDFDDVLTAVADERPLRETFDLIAQRSAEFGAFDFCGILLLEDDASRVHLAGAYRFPDRYQELLDGIFRVPLDDETLLASPTSRALRQGRTVVLSDALADPSYEPWRALAEGFGFGSLVSVPLVFRGEAVGVLNGYSRASRTFTDAELAAMETMALQAAVALRLSMLVDARNERIAELRAVNDELEHQRSVLERAHDIHLRLTETVMSGGDENVVAQVLAGLVGRAVAVTDALGQVVGSSTEPPPGDELLAAARDHGRAPEPSDIGGGESSPLALLAAPVTVGDERVGHVVVAEVDTRTRDLDLRALEHGATVIAVHVAKERVARATEERLHADFLGDLFDGAIDEDRLRIRARHHGLVITDEHRVVVVMVLDAPAATRPGSAATNRPGRGTDRAFASVAATLRSRLPGAVSRRAGHLLTAVVPADGPGGAASCESVARELRRRAADVAVDVDVFVGIGTSATDVGDYRASYDSARRCAQALQRMGRRGGVLAADDLGVVALFLNSDRPGHLVAMARGVLGPLIANDTRTGGALLATLESYLDNGCDVAAAAEALTVHPNTVKYRLRRVEHLTGLDLRRPDDLLRATVARLSRTLLEPDPRDAPCHRP